MTEEQRLKIGECSAGVAKSMYIVDMNDLVFEGNTVVRIKRKYGKFKRAVIKIDCGQKENKNHLKHTGNE